MIVDYSMLIIVLILFNEINICLFNVKVEFIFIYYLKKSRLLFLGNENVYGNLEMILY